MPSITRFLSLHRERVRHGPVRYLRCLWRDLGFFLFFSFFNRLVFRFIFTSLDQVSI